MFELKDPGIAPMTTVTKVKTTGDLRYTNIYISVLGEAEADKTIESLNRAKGFIRKEIGANLNLRYTPEPIFIYDDSISHAQRMSKLIDELNTESLKNNESSEDIIIEEDTED